VLGEERTRERGEHHLEVLRKLCLTRERSKCGVVELGKRLASELTDVIATGDAKSPMIDGAIRKLREYLGTDA